MTSTPTDIRIADTLAAIRTIVGNGPQRAEYVGAGHFFFAPRELYANRVWTLGLVALCAALVGPVVVHGRGEPAREAAAQTPTPPAPTRSARRVTAYSARMGPIAAPTEDAGGADAAETARLDARAEPVPTAPITSNEGGAGTGGGFARDHRTPRASARSRGYAPSRRTTEAFAAAPAPREEVHNDDEDGETQRRQAEARREALEAIRALRLR